MRLSMLKQDQKLGTDLTVPEDGTASDHDWPRQPIRDRPHHDFRGHRPDVSRSRSKGQASLSENSLRGQAATG